MGDEENIGFDLGDGSGARVVYEDEYLELKAECERLRKDAKRFLWLTDYCWYNVLSENQRRTGFDLEDVIDKAMALEL